MINRGKVVIDKGDEPKHRIWHEWKVRKNVLPIEQKGVFLQPKLKETNTTRHGDKPTD